MSHLKIFDSNLHKQDSPKNVRYPPVSNSYFSSIIDIKTGYLRLGEGLFYKSNKYLVNYN